MKNAATISRVVSLFVLLLALPSMARADPVRILRPVAVGAVNDVPVDGVGDTVVSEPLISRVDRAAFAQNVFSAILEFDLSSLGPSIRHANFSAIVAANNFTDTGPRTIALSVFAGNGTVDAGDFAIDARRFGTITYHPISDVRAVAFGFRVTPLLQQLLDDGAGFAGVRFDALNFQAPSTVDRQGVFGFAPLLRVDTSPVPEPTSLVLLGGALTAAAMRRRKKGSERF